MRAQVIAVDMDGTLCEEDCWTKRECILATPRKDMIKLVNSLHEFNFIIIFTARRHRLYAVTATWLKKHGVKYHAIRMEKLPAYLYIDDRALTPEEAMRRIHNEAQ